ncbi:MAG: hypothetical protein U0869_19665 [Chloroflexota bacterium]
MKLALAASRDALDVTVSPMATMNGEPVRQQRTREAAGRAGDAAEPRRQLVSLHLDGQRLAGHGHPADLGRAEADGVGERGSSTRIATKDAEAIGVSGA